MVGDAEGALESISRASELYRKQRMLYPLFVIPYMATRFSVDVEQMKRAILLNDFQEAKRWRKNVRQLGKMVIKNAHKNAFHRTKAFRLVGQYYWVIDKQGKALKWWSKSIQEGEGLGARPDLSRTYFEVGKSLLDPKSKHKKLNGIDAKGYLEKARTLFEEMGLERELEELELITQGR